MNFRSWSIKHLVYHFKSSTSYITIISKILLVLVLVLAYSCAKKTPTKATPPSAQKLPTKPKDTTHTTPKPKAETKASKAKTLNVAEQIDYLKANSPWVDSVFNTLTLDERIAQLIMFDAYSFKNKAHLDTLIKLVKDQKIGGLIFLKGTPVKQVKMINSLQAASKVPLLIAMDAEYGIGMRLDSTNKYPFQMTLGAIQDNKLIYEMGKAIAYDVKRVGMHVNFAPVLDINNNPENPVIGIRSFGEDKHSVTAKSLAYMKGLQDNKVLATAKHFPGHGDTDVDSHKDLPLIAATKERLDTLELYPFRELIEEGLGGIMVAHMSIPALDDTPNLPSTLSKAIITDLLKKEMGFNGLIFTDAMVMEGVAKHYPSGVAEPMAVISGNDVLEKMKSARVAIRSIRQAVEKGDISEEMINEKCRKILATKEWVGLDKLQPIDLKNIYSDLKNADTDSLQINLIRNAATLLANEDQVLPLKNESNLKIATVSLNAGTTTPFQKHFDEKLKSDHFYLPLKSTTTAISKMKQSLAGYDLVVVAIYDTRSWPMFNLNYTPQMKSFVNDLINTDKAIVTMFGNAYALNDFDEMENSKAVLLMYEKSVYTEKVAVEILTGKVKPKGKLPVTVTSQFKYGFGL